MKIINVTPEMTVLPLGRLGENETTQFVFDVSDWLEEYPGGTIGLANRLPHTKVSYPCAIVSEGDGKYSWTITSAELTTEGDGKCELLLTKDSKVKKGKLYKTRIGEALDGDADPPSVWQGFVTDVLHKKEEAEDAAEAAEDARDAIQDMGVEATTLQPGTGATVAKTVDPVTGAVTLTFGIPKGLPGNETIDDTAGAGDTDKVWSADKTYKELYKDYVICDTLSTSAEEASNNSTKLNTLLAEHDVILKTGNYPFVGGISITGKTLDLGGSKLYTTEYEASRKLFVLEGNSPCIMNGEICGVISGTESGETAISISSSSDVVIKDLVIHDISGRGISGNLNSQYGQRTAVATAESYSTSNYIHWSGNISIISGYKYVRTVGSYGFNTIYTTEDVTYNYYDSSDTLLKTDRLPPSVNSEIPDEASYVVVGTETGKSGQTDGFIPYQVGFTNHNNKCTIINCVISNCYEWSIANLFGESLLKKVDMENIDIEDHQATYFTMEDCSITKNSFIRSYYAFYKNTKLYAIRPQYGKVHQFINCNGSIVPPTSNFYMHPAICISGGDINIFELSGTGLTDEQKIYVKLLFTSGPVLSPMYNHTVDFGGATGFLCRYQGFRRLVSNFEGIEKGVYINRGTEYGPPITIATKHGSDLIIYTDNETIERQICTFAKGDCYGITYLNGIIYPNKNTISNSYFKPKGSNISTMSADQGTGKYVNCVFDAKDYYPIATNHDKALEFVRCKFINLDQHTIVKDYTGNVDTLVFTDCDFDGHSILDLDDAEDYIIESATNATITIDGHVLTSTPVSNDYIPLPASPSSGDFLCYNGTSWVATSLSAWQGGSY